MEETSWRQNPREIWLREGDKNTGFFHKMANAHSRSNLLTKVRVNGALLAEVDDTKDRVCRAFHTLLAKSRDWRLTIRVLCFKVLGRESSSILEGLSWRRKF